MVYSIWLINPKFYNTSKKLKINNLLSTSYFYFLSKDHQLAYFSMLMPNIGVDD